MDKYDPKLIKAALVEIAPASERADECEDAIRLKVATLRVAQGIEGVTQTPRRARASLAKLERALRAVEKAANSLPFPYFLWPTFLDRIERERKGVESILSTINVRPGARRADYVKSHAVKFARELLVMFGQKPTLTLNGPWPKLAEHLFEAALGERADLYEHCRAYHDRNRPRKPRR